MLSSWLLPSCFLLCVKTKTRGPTSGVTWQGGRGCGEDHEGEIGLKGWARKITEAQDFCSASSGLEGAAASGRSYNWMTNCDVVRISPEKKNRNSRWRRRMGGAWAALREGGVPTVADWVGWWYGRELYFLSRWAIVALVMQIPYLKREMVLKGFDLVVWCFSPINQG